ncbi:MAG: pantoate--beta-alanine ligase [Deltaproteobacteria bacterium]|nr:MAG: pantoate--beta-alanine ligase [Deltaproteobacteria bacterium]
MGRVAARGRRRILRPVRILRTREEVRAWRTALPAGRRVAFVPTMGFLHEGHLSLLREARRRVPRDAGEVVLSIFVNPTQFDRADDLATYPRDEAGDLAKAESVGVDVAFCPTDPAELYPPGHATFAEVERLDRHLCGATRPGHFRGVCTVVLKLWNLVRPDVALFGEKDFQQLAILRRMHRDLFLGGEIVGMPIVREPDGLAMSSRNANLSPSARQEALALPRFLQTVRARFDAGEREVARLLEGAASALAPGRIDYVSVVDAEELAPVERVEAPAVAAAAVFYGGVRLIDNVRLDPSNG